MPCSTTKNEKRLHLIGMFSGETQCSVTTINCTLCNNISLSLEFLLTINIDEERDTEMTFPCAWSNKMGKLKVREWKVLSAFRCLGALIRDNFSSSWKKHPKWTREWFLRLKVLSATFWKRQFSFMTLCLLYLGLHAGWLLNECVFLPN